MHLSYTTNVQDSPNRKPENHFQSWSDIQTMVFYMKLYKAVEYGYEEQYERPIEKEFMVFVLHRIMTTQELRKEAMTIFRERCPFGQGVFLQTLGLSGIAK